MTTKTKKMASPHGARRVTAYLNNIASVVQSNYEALGLPKKIAYDFALRCDMLSDSIEGQYGAKYASFFNPATIAEEVPGPIVNDPTQPFMAGHFTQEQFNALSDKQESGALAAAAASHNADPKLAALIQKAASEAATAAALAMFKALTRKAGEDEDEKAAGADAPAKAEDAPKAEEKKAAEDEDEKAAGADAAKAEDAEDEAKKTASLFGLFANK